MTGVVGGVGARTLTRLLAGAIPAQTIHLTPQQRYCDVLVTSVHASANDKQLPRALSFIVGRPLLVVMHTVPGPIPSLSRAKIRSATAHVHDVVHVPFFADWVKLPEQPGRGELPKKMAAVRAEVLAALRSSWAAAEEVARIQRPAPTQPPSGPFGRFVNLTTPEGQYS
ncbi:hypothetical protein [Amycolatopsis sp. NPDC051903]|uniref:hypothetical protein n=1 Tax=Amycolatopsis sp. NPDC051903 TaxID=3363936 RepID=UPI003788DA89